MGLLGSLYTPRDSSSLRDCRIMWEKVSEVVGRDKCSQHCTVFCMSVCLSVSLCIIQGPMKCAIEALTLCSSSLLHLHRYFMLSESFLQ